MDDSIECNQVNEALVKFVHTGWSKEIAQEIKNACGAEIALKVKAVYDAAMSCPVDWRIENMNSALGILADFLAAEFPWLSGEARTRLNYCYIMEWK